MTGWLILVGVGLALAAIAAVYVCGRRDGEAAERSRRIAADLTTIKEARDVQDDIGRLPDGAVAGQLRDRWRRD